MGLLMEHGHHPFEIRQTSGKCLGLPGTLFTLTIYISHPVLQATSLTSVSSI